MGSETHTPDNVRTFPQRTAAGATKPGMTASDGFQFRELVRQVAAGRGKAVTDDMLDGLWLLISDLPFAEFRDGLLAAAKATRYFPTAADIREYARKIRQAECQGQPVQRTDSCPDCDDTGWISEWKITHQTETLYGEGKGARVARPCPCRPTNAVWQAKRAATRRLGTPGE